MFCHILLIDKFDFKNSFTLERLEEFEDTKTVIRIRISKKNRNTVAKRKCTKGQATIYKTFT
jgi:hypothetical protein